MANIRIDDFKAKLKGGGARPNMFEVEIAVGNSRSDPTKVVELGKFLVKAASLPASVIAPVVVQFRGRQVQLAGDKTFEPWTITIINDTTMELRNAFEAWSNYIENNQSNEGVANPADYKVDMAVYQLDQKGQRVKGYKLVGTWPSNVSAIDLSFDNENTVEEFTVELQVDYWLATGVEGQTSGLVLRNA